MYQGRWPNRDSMKQTTGHTEQLTDLTKSNIRLFNSKVILLRLVERWARKPVNHTSWVAVVTPTDRPKSVRNRCLIELFCGVVCPFDISVVVGAFVIGLSQISSFFSWSAEYLVE